MTTECRNLGLTEPLRFLKSTVLSFNTSIGLGSSAESTLTVDLVDDCDAENVTLGGSFSPVYDPVRVQVGAPVYFPDNPPGSMPFRFGGVLTSWTKEQSQGGYTYNVKVSDPRQLLENAVVVLDSYLGMPAKSINYFNVYSYLDNPNNELIDQDCDTFGSSRSNDRGTPYVKIINALSDMDPTILSPTCYYFKVDFSTFPGWTGTMPPGGRQVPDWYRIPGPSISLLELLQNICDLLSYDFYVELVKVGFDNIIKIGLIDLSLPPSSFEGIVNTYAASSTDISYGEELRNDKTKTVLFGDQVHYMSIVTQFDHFFGEDMVIVNDKLIPVPVVPYKYDNCGFWINKRIESLNLVLKSPLASNGPYQISELDIRSAMSSYELWKNRTFDKSVPGSFNAAVRAKWPALITDRAAVINTLVNVGGALSDTKTAMTITDAMFNPSVPEVQANLEQITEEVQKVHSFVANLGNTYYGKQFICRLNQRICYYDDPDLENPERVFSDVPTNAGGWVDFGVPVLRLFDPELGLFRENDNRIGAFATFSIVGNSGVGPDIYPNDTTPPEWDPEEPDLPPQPEPPE